MRNDTDESDAHVNRPPIIGVIGGADPSAHDEVAREVGRRVAEAGYVLVTGGGNGVMFAASQGAAQAGGLVLGILGSDGPGSGFHTKEYPNPSVRVPIYTGMHEARNAVIVNTAHILICLPGEAGTLSEVALALKHGTPVVVTGWPELRIPFPVPPAALIHAPDAASAMDAVTRLLAKRRG